MKNILSIKWKYGKVFLYISIIVCFSIIAYYHLKSGYSMAGDSQRFSKWADELIKFNFNFYDFFSLEKDDHRPPLFFFSLPVFLMAICKVIFGNEWQFAFLLLNLLLVFFSLLIFAKCLLLIEVRPLLITLSLSLIIISADILTWPKFILSDTSYAFLVIVAIYFITKGIVKNKINYFELFLIIFLLLASRPSSIPVIFAISLFIMVLLNQIFLTPKKTLLFLIALFALTPVFFGLLYLFMEYNVNTKSFDEVAYQDYIYKYVKSGMIVHGRPETWVDPPNNFFDVVYIYFLRLVNFFNPYASTFSILHILLNIIQTLTLLFSLFIWLIFGGDSKIKDRTFVFIIILSFSVAAFHSFTLIDYDWRYRFPLILPLLILFPLSLEIYVKKKFA